MNDLRQQQMVAATSSSGSESGTAVESAAATSTAGSAGAAGRPQSNCSANSNAKSVAASSTSEEEQRVSSTSSPAQRDQQLNADRDREQDPEPQQQQQQREEALQHQNNQPGHITSTTASPPPTLPPPTTPCDDAPSTTGASASASSASGEAPSAASAAGAAGGAMAATALEVESEERDGHKIILKLSKHANPNSNANESQPGGDERRVEPLRIQLPCGGAEGGLVAKPQDAFDADASSCSSSCAEDEVATTLGQQLRNTPHIVPKLTIRAANERRVGSVVPKLTIKLPENPAASGSNSNSGSCSAAVSGAQSAMPAKNDAHLSSLSPASASSSSASSSSSSSSSSSLAEMQTVPKLMIKTTLAGSSCISSSEELPQQQQIPKLTIKTGGGGQEHVHTVIMTHDLNNAQSIPKLTIKTKSIEMIEDEQAAKLEQQLQPLPKLTIKNLCSPKHKVRAVLEEKPPTAASKLAIPKPTPNPTPAPMTNGGESNSSSQEFCGFSDLDADIAAPASDVVRRNSDDMVIDDSLSKEHDPKIFHNLPPMPASNGIASGGSKAGKASKPAQSQHNVVDMVDLTSSPSPGSSPTHVPNNFTGRISPKGLLIDCLRMQTAMGVYVSEEADSRVMPAASPNSNILLSQLTAPAKSFTTATPKSKSSKYPQLTERLMANGSGTGGGSVIAAEGEAVVGPLAPANPTQSIIESIEILDTPDGSPRVAYMDEDSNPMLNKHLQTIHKLAMDHGVEQRMDTQDNNNENHLKRTSSEGNESPSSRLPPSKQRRLDNDENDQQTQNCHDPARKCSESLQALPPSHRSRKQKHERILNTDLEGSLFPPTQQQAISTPDQNGALSSEVDAEDAKAQDPLEPATPQPPPVATPAGTGKKRGRPKRVQNQSSADGGVAVTPKPGTPQEEVNSAVKSRRVQLLRKRLAIDMVSVGQEQADIKAKEKESSVGVPIASVEDGLAEALESPKTRDHRPLRATRRTVTSTNTNLQPTPKSTRKRQSKASVQQSPLPPPTMSQFGSSEAESNNNNSSISFALSAQIDLTMCSSSSSTSSGAAANQQVIVGSGSSSMLPPTTILSSSDPLPDVIFQPNDFSSIMATQQLRSSRPSSISSAGGSQPDCHDEDNYTSALDNSGDETALPMLSIVTPTRGRGRGRRSRGGRGRGSSSGDRAASAGGTASTTPATQPRAPRMSRGASAVAKAIAMSRPRCVGGLKHQPDPERLKGLFSPSPQVFEEDTRMSADLSNSNQSMASLMEPPLTPQKQPDFLNNEESQSSMVSNVSMMDSNQGQSADAILGSALKRPKKKKMETCVAEDTDYSASSIAEYDWPPPKGCCPSKNRDTFMIQEQVALYLGITSFKRKYPDLPRRSVDMEERNWLQEKGLVSEKLCDLGITAVWASDILDIMYADFFDKYEEYKEYIRRKHLREIEAKQKALGLTVGAGRGLQARDRAMLSASKWNSYFNKSRKDERQCCMDLQTFTINQPQPRTAPTCTRLERSTADLVREVAEEANIPAPPNLLLHRVYDEAFRNSDYAYPLTVVPDQFSMAYRQFEPAELRAYPLDTALDKPSTDLMAQLLQAKSEAVGSEEIKTSAPAPKDLGQEQSAIKSVTVTAPVRRSRRSARQQTDKVRTASSSSTSSAQSASSASSGNGSSSDTESGDESDFSSTSSCSSSTGASSGAGSEDEDGNECSSSVRLSNCGVCLRSQHRNARDMPEAFIRCYTCRKRVHPSCVDMPPRMVGRVRNYNWQCAGCKCCIKCRGSQRPGKMLFCEQCDRGYHIYCLGLKTVPDGRWSCERCCFCVRCGATKPEGLPQVAALSQASGGPAANGDRSKAARNKRLKWVHEYRIDHVTKIREHAAMFCVPCARNKPAKRQSAAGAAGTAAVPPVLEATSARTDDSPMPSPGLTTNGGRSLSPTAALSPKAAVPVASLPPVLEATAVTTNIAATIGRRQAGNAVNITTMQCNSSSGSSSFSGNGVAEDAANVTATGTATAAAGAPAATPIGIAPPPVVA
ncbi:supporter of activation of yellow protein [Drosophila mauritiana]|uniref:Supporter of activation of yellow protein n=1 Tax=Drosophila mauritiana TaxID=7226 RepID=A0A6P8KPY1_DROMA|nr:supporter of activation of yellow protein [Drosophila mauritiana]XP_033171102.1 supporter of activation of yellow protein [Drosophila mauritiana]XP_033171103.1 supporter of activation of yellow protein [Drosophila mauritiana]